MKFTAALLFAFAILAVAANPAAAKDCGMPPGDGPVIPDGRTTTNDQIGIAIRAVQDYGFEVQTYTTCLQLNQDAHFLNMTEAQRKRWTDDFNALADRLTEVETSLNDQIKIFNNR